MVICKKSLMENFILCAVISAKRLTNEQIHVQVLQEES